MTKNGLTAFNTYLKKNVETPLIKFLKKYSVSNQGLDHKKTFPSHLKQINPKTKTLVNYCYPYSKKDCFKKDCGYKLEKLDKLKGDTTYLGNISIEILLEKTSKISQKNYSFKFWYSENQYMPKNNSSDKFQEINFNFRIEKDQRHSKDELEFHSSFLHSRPRIYSKHITITGFLNYIENHIFLLTEEVANGVLAHISKANRI